MRMERRPASAMSARTRSAPTFPVARSVAVLSLWAIIASSTERAWVVPARFEEHRAAEHAHAVVDGQLLVLGQQARLDVAQVLAEHEGLVGAGGEEEEVRLVRDAAERTALADVDQVALGPRQGEEPPERRVKTATRSSAPLIGAVVGRCRPAPARRRS